MADALCLHQQHVYKIIKGQRRPTNEVLERLAQSQLFQVTLAELRGWRAVDDYTDDEIIEALKAIYPVPQERRLVLEQLLKQLQQTLSNGNIFQALSAMSQGCDVTRLFQPDFTVLIWGCTI